MELIAAVVDVKVVVGVAAEGEVMIPNMGWESNSRVALRVSTGGVGRSEGELDEPREREYKIAESSISIPRAVSLAGILSLN